MSVLNMIAFDGELVLEHLSLIDEAHIFEGDSDSFGDSGFEFAHTNF